MALFTRPDVYVSYKKSGAPSVSVGSSTFGLVGLASRGDIGIPTLVSSYNEWASMFGGIVPESLAGYQVKGFFDNGGKYLKFLRLAKNAVKASLAINDASSALIGTIKAINEGTWGNAVKIEIKDVVAPAFTIVVTGDDGKVEAYNLAHVSGLADALSVSAYVRFTLADSSKTIKAVAQTALSGGDNGYTGIADADYVSALSLFDATDIDMLAVAVTTTVAQKGLADYCANRGECQAIISTPTNGTVNTDKVYLTTITVGTEFAQCYAPAVKVVNPVTGAIVTVPNEGHIAGYIAATDAQRGVQKAPAGAGIDLKGIVGLAYEATPSEQGQFNANHVNIIIKRDNAYLVWGARTADKVGKMKYVNSQRTLVYVAKLVKANSAWSVFENNNDEVNSAIANDIRAKLLTEMNNGLFASKKEEEAFFVICDKTNNPQTVVDAGERYIDIGVAVNKPAEFVIVRVGLI